MSLEAYNDLEWNDAEAEAADLGTSPERLEELSYSRSHDVRCWVAHNPSASPDTLTRLAKSRYSAIRNRVETNPSAPPAVKLWLQSDYRHSMTLEEFLEAAQETS